MSLDTALQRLWYGPAWRTVLLWPLSLVFGAIVAVRGALYRSGLLRSLDVGVPVIVVGNVTVGGTGKTPVAAWLARALALRGHRVGVVLRGYGGTHQGAPRIVGLSDNPTEVGDEAILHVRRGAHVVVIGGDRVGAARLAVAQGAEVIVADDGLQHLRLAREYELAVIDGARGLGNGWLLPAGPLREPARRLERVQAVITTDRGAHAGVASHRATSDLRGPLQVTARFALGDAVNVTTAERRPLASFRGAPGVHAVAGIGHPEGFFAALRSAGLEFTAHALPDHAALDLVALPFPAGATVLMTEKDAVKCRDAGQPGWWWVDLDVQVGRADAEALLVSILERTGLGGAGVLPVG